ncbi:MAG: hypothetical protein ACHP7J_00190 [Terriglobales bacterium]
MRTPTEDVRVWLKLEDDGDALFIVLDERPDFFASDGGESEEKDHWLQYCLSHEPIYDWFGLSIDGKWRPSVQQWALENGIAPGQRFLCELSYWHSYDPWSNEHDEGMYHEVVEIEPWPVDRILGAWCTWWMSSLLIGGEFPK